ncbi:aldose epimerase [Flavobacterium akiainvivens]|uniref:Aldose 1-epimerase n=1 Tax=Flavobacterium akiainvivens TaxID=1202724 RepID=A0A0M9VHR8_9FLAO|nr:aldose epimerase family protein [Flavobacterium akiainvivens]KOS05842.1 aldose epimerase [Flavobacterium akiainvivens]SFQ56899.1 aldose 1-epimerase [Flavobacterium akiainvivens]
MTTSEYIAHHNGKAVFEFRLTNIHGNYVELTNYGAIVKSIVVPDKYGDKANVVLGYPTFKGYFFDKCYIGVTVGPFANRIANACFEVDGQVFNLDRNDGPSNNNHSGSAGWHNKVWGFTAADDAVTFTLRSTDGDGGFPGNIEAKTTYRWTDDNQLLIDYHVVTDKPTHVNLTNHSYFNLSGCAETIHNHKLVIRAEQMLESTPHYIPTGQILPVGNQGFNGTAMAEVMNGGGLNNYYIFDNQLLENEPLCTLWHECSGRVMETYTTYPGVQLYTGDYLGGDCNSAHGSPYKPFDGLCLECQFYPDSPNHGHFPSTLLRPGQEYRHSITYKFDVLF